MSLSEELQAIENYPDISFIDNYTISQLEEDMIAWFKEKKKELTGEDVVLGKADDRRILLQVGAYYIYQGYMFIDNAGKMGLLKYSMGDYLENLGALKHISREGAQAATTTIRFSMNSVRTSATGIPEGTRVTAGDSVYFATDEYCEIPIGELYVDVGATCTTTGSSGNDYGVGDINTIVDPVPYVDSAENITAPENGADIEVDDPSYRQRIYIAPSSYSTAGTQDAYEYFVREYNSEVSDIYISNPSDGVVQIRYLLADGEIPGEESMSGLLEYLSDSTRKPLCDSIEIVAPDTVSYDLDATYYINTSNQSTASTIQAQVENAIEEYKLWQGSKMGRDLNPDMLRKMVVEAGAKRMEIRSPEFTVVESGTVPILNTRTITYGGLEYD